MALSHKRMMAKKARKAAARKGKTYQPKQKYVVMNGQAVPQSKQTIFSDSNTALVDEIKIS